MNKKFLSLFQQHDMNTSERLAILCIAAAHDGITYDELAEQMGVLKDRACRVVWKLRDLGIVDVPVVHKEARVITLVTPDAYRRTWDEMSEFSDKMEISTAINNFAEDHNEDNAVAMLMDIERYL